MQEVKFGDVLIFHLRNLINSVVAMIEVRVKITAIRNLGKSKPEFALYVLIMHFQ